MQKVHREGVERFQLAGLDESVRLHQIQTEVSLQSEYVYIRRVETYPSLPDI